MDETAPKQDIALASAAGTEAKKSPENPISAAISALIHKLHDFEECADKFVPSASQLRVDRLNEVAGEITEIRGSPYV